MNDEQLPALESFGASEQRLFDWNYDARTLDNDAQQLFLQPEQLEGDTSDDEAEAEVAPPRRLLKRKPPILIAPQTLPRVQTIHSTANVGCPVDTRLVARCCTNVEFCPPSAVCLAIRLEGPTQRAMVRVWNSGKMVCMGGRSAVEACCLLRMAARKVQRAYQNASKPAVNDTPAVTATRLALSATTSRIGFHDFQVHNVAASGALGYRVNLRTLSRDPVFADYVEYDPEKWHGLYYRIPIDPTKTIQDVLPSVDDLLARIRAQDTKIAGQFDPKAVGTTGHETLNYFNDAAAATSRKRVESSNMLGVMPSGASKGQVLTATIYGNGIISLTGVQTEEAIQQVYQRLWHIVKPFAMSDVPTATLAVVDTAALPRIYVRRTRSQPKLEPESVKQETQSVPAQPQIDMPPGVSEQVDDDDIEWE